MVVNACQALTEPNRSLCIATGYLEESEEIYLKVQDSGRGMTAEVLAQAKDPFSPPGGTAAAPGWASPFPTPSSATMAAGSISAPNPERGPPPPSCCHATVRMKLSGE